MPEYRFVVDGLRATKEQMEKYPQGGESLHIAAYEFLRGRGYQVTGLLGEPLKSDKGIIVGDLRLMETALGVPLTIE